MKKIYLHGKLKSLGESFDFDVESPRMVIKALMSQVEGFADMYKELGDISMYKKCGDRTAMIEESMLDFKLGSYNEIHLSPAMRGEGGDSGRALTKVALGAALFFGAPMLAGSVMGPLTTGQIAAVSVAQNLGVAIALQGVSVALTPEVKEEASPDEDKSYIFNGPTNTSQQGVAVPLVYGDARVGSVIISSGLETERL
mgnify:FL=1|tara:strand:+ start:6632 stop:7228 length:597 start_codon:yes stop_codon:yes gene_type:complete